MQELIAEAEVVFLRHGFEPVAQERDTGTRPKTITAVVAALDPGERATVSANCQQLVPFKDMVDIDQLDAAIACYPATPMDHDTWRDNLMFPIANAIRRAAPEHEARLRAIFDREC